MLRHTDVSTEYVVAISVLASVALLGYVALVRWIDRYEREPLKQVAIAFVWGMVSAFLSAIVTGVLAFEVRELAGKAFEKMFFSTVLAPTFEELFKGALVVGMIRDRRQIDTITDGFVYGATAGLGFAFVENISFYAWDTTGYIAELAFVRTVFSATVHVTSSGLLGMALVYAFHRFAGARRYAVAAAGCALAMLNHAIWNGITAVSNYLDLVRVYNASTTINKAILAVVVVVVALLVRRSLREEREAIREHLLAEAARGTLPEEHASIVADHKRRAKDDWLPAGVDRKTYVEAATLLAFRLWRLEWAEGEEREELEEDAERLREQVRALAARAPA